ncbi:unnamed protein product [Prunus armeniaca]
MPQKWFFIVAPSMIPISPRKFHIRINGGLLLLLGNGTGSAHIWWIKHPQKILPCRRTQSNCLRRLPHVMAMVLVGPFAYVLERRKQRPSLSFSVAAKIFVLALFGTTIYLNVYYAGLAYTSPTVACALSNVIPSLTFLMAVLLGLEKLKIRTARGQAKVAGTLFCIGGSLVFTFWKGGYLFKGFVNISVGEMRHEKENWIKGHFLF